MWNPHHNVLLASCVCVHASLQLCKVGILCVTLACRSRRNIVPPFLFFRKRCVGACVPPAAHCYLSSRRKQLQFLLDVFLCLFGFCSLQWKQKRKKQISTCGYMCVRVLCGCVCLFVWIQAKCGGMGAWWGWFLTRKPNSQTHTHRRLVTHCQTSVYNMYQQSIHVCRRGRL